MERLESLAGQYNLNGAEKAAALLFAMGKDAAVKLADFFSREELNRLNEAANNLRKLDYETIDTVVREFRENYITQGAFADADSLDEILEDITSNSDAEEENAKAAAASAALAVGDIPPLEHLQAFVESEPPLIAVFLLGTLDNELAAQVLSGLEPELRNSIFKAYLERKTFDPEIEAQIKSNLFVLIKEMNRGDGSEEKIEAAAGIINFFPEEAGDEVVGFIENNDPAIAAIIKKSIFKFSSIDQLTKPARSLLMDGIEAEDIVKALTESKPELQESILEVLSQRNRRMVEAELARSTTAPEEIQAVQRKIAGRALALSKEGKIELPGTEEAEAA